MKRNKTASRKGRSGNSPYNRYKKRPCQHCQAITQDNRNRAQRGASRYAGPMEGTNG
jgi:hypothetical protein